MGRKVSGGIEKFNSVKFKKQLGVFIKNKTNLKVNYQETSSDDSICFLSKISKFSITEDADDHILDVTFRNKREVSIVLPKDRLKTNRVSVEGELQFFEARTDEGKSLLGIGFEVI